MMYGHLFFAVACGAMGLAMASGRHWGGAALNAVSSIGNAVIFLRWLFPGVL